MAIARVCVRCGEDAGGLLFCSDCAPSEKVRQDVTIRMTSPIAGVVDGNGRLIDQTPGQGITDVRAKFRPILERKPAREVTSIDKANHDRQRIERRTIYKDRGENVYAEVWQDMDTGEVTYNRQAALDDQSHHGEWTRRSQEQGLDGLTPPSYE
jgi:hypothetical protein